MSGYISADLRKTFRDWAALAISLVSLCFAGWGRYEAANAMRISVNVSVGQKLAEARQLLGANGRNAWVFTFTKDWNRIMLADSAVAEALKMDPNSTNALLLKALCLVAKKKQHEALKITRPLARKDRNLGAQLVLGRIYFEQSQYTEALAVYESATKAFPSESAPIEGIAAIYEKQGRLQLALEYAIKAASLLEMDPAPWVRVAHLRSKMQDWQGALDAVNKALEQGSTDPRASEIAAWAYYELKQFDIAAQKLRKARDGYMAEGKSDDRIRIERFLKISNSRPSPTDSRASDN